MTGLSDEKREIMEEYLTSLSNLTDLDVIKKMKDILNKFFGEAYNQIFKPSVEDIITEQIRSGGPSLRAIDTSSNSNALSWFKGKVHQSSFYRIYIHIPEVTITNSRKDTHLIKDLYLKITVSAKGLIQFGIQGLRATVSIDEYYAGYAHSHLHTFDPRNIFFDTFCTGTGEINQILLLLSRSFSEVNFTLFCLHLKNFIAWESIEGTPYRNMTDVGVRSENRGAPELTSMIVMRNVNDLISHFRDKSDFSSLITVNLSQNKVTVAPTEDLELRAGEYLDSRITSRSSARDMGEVVFKDSEGNYFSTHSPRAEQIDYQKEPIFKFKDKDIFFKIENIEQHEKRKPQVYANPQITEQMCKQLSRNFTKILFEAKGNIKLEDTSNSVTEVATSDKVSVRESVGEGVERTPVLSDGGDVRHLPF